MGGQTLFFFNILGGLTLLYTIFFGNFSETLIFCHFLRKIFEMVLLQLYRIGGTESFFEDENERGAVTFFKIGFGGAQYFFCGVNWERGQRVFLDRKIRDFPGGVTENFVHSFMMFVLIYPY